MGHDHHGPAYTVPDYKKFKVDGIVQLEELQTALNKRGLKDPWIRNEAWRYDPGFGTRGKRALKFFFRGLPIGLGLALIHVGIDKARGGGAHGHGDHH